MNIGLEVVEKFVFYLDKGMILFVVNFLEIVLLLIEGKYCLFYIYKNVLGVLLKINNLFVEYGINIFG